MRQILQKVLHRELVVVCNTAHVYNSVQKIIIMICKKYFPMLNIDLLSNV